MTPSPYVRNAGGDVLSFGIAERASARVILTSLVALGLGSSLLATLTLCTRQGGTWAHVFLFGVALVLSLNLYLIILFANWVFDELGETVAGRRSSPPALLNRIRITEFERVWHTVEALKRAARNKALLEISTRVAHDIRSPLTALGVVADLMPDLAEPKRSILRHAIARMNDIASELMEQSKGAGDDPRCSCVPKAKVPAEWAILPAEIELLVSEKRFQYRDRNGIEITADVAAATNVIARMTPTEFTRTLSNLVDNAVDACGARGQIQITCGLVSLGLRVEVRDNGPGMPSEVLGRVGERGFSFGKRALAGRGLGLGIHHARKTMELVGGRLRIASQPGQGTTVTLIVPLVQTVGQRPKSAGTQQESANQSGSTSGTVALKS